VFIDGLHTPEGVEMDFCISYPLLVDGGFMVFDDYFEDSVADYREAIDILAKKHDVALTKDAASRLVYLQKIGHVA